eukprot:m.24270 g.24270  ORF g.24270 m.24270 type:complete len:324 (+) comp8580_c1_seq1:652-1623(+)
MMMRGMPTSGMASQQPAPLVKPEKPDNMIALLNQLSVVGEVEEDHFVSRLSELISDDETTIQVVCGEDDEMVAIGSLVVERKFIHAGGAVGHLEDLVVEEAQRRKGHGKAIVEKLKQFAKDKGCYKVLVDCKESNVPFYEKCGFKVKGACMSQYHLDSFKKASPHRVTPSEHVFNSGQFIVRALRIEDAQKGYLDLLSQLTVVGEVPDQVFQDRLVSMEQHKQYFLVIEKTDDHRIVGAGTLVLEKKLIRQLGSVAHLEDVVVDSSIRGQGLGKQIILYLTRLSQQLGCYKTVLDCSEHNVAFYERCGFALTHSSVSMACYFE